jgi:hypothetical protein
MAMYLAFPSEAQIPDDKAGGEEKMNHPLSEAVTRFCKLGLDLPDSDLEQEWSWGSYESEGVRFAYFRTYEQLRELAVKIRAARDEPISEAQLILAQYHAAYLDLQAAVLGIGSDLVEMPPGEGEWPLRRVYAHILGADLGFYVVVKYSLDRYRQGIDPFEEIQDETWLAIAGIGESDLDSLMAGPLAGLQSYHRDLQARIIDDFTDVSDSELELPAKYWEKEHLNLRFRLHRFDSHMRQHIIQVDKTLVGLGSPPNEIRRLIRLIFAALAEVDNAALGAAGIDRTMKEELAIQIDTRTDEIEAILKG